MITYCCMHFVSDPLNSSGVIFSLRFLLKKEIFLAQTKTVNIRSKIMHKKIVGIIRCFQNNWWEWDRKKFVPWDWFNNFWAKERKRLLQLLLNCFNLILRKREKKRKDSIGQEANKSQTISIIVYTTLNVVAIKWWTW